MRSEYTGKELTLTYFKYLQNVRSHRDLDSGPGLSTGQLQLVVIFKDTELVGALSDILASESAGYQESNSQRYSYFHPGSSRSINWTEVGGRSVEYVIPPRLS